MTPGHMTGMMTIRKAWNCEQPSTFALSSSSLGIDWKKDRYFEFCDSADPVFDLDGATEWLRCYGDTVRITAAEGAPVARTLSAKCATLRSTMAADQEAKARVRNDKITPPLVGMALLFMVLIIYPALQLN